MSEADLDRSDTVTQRRDDLDDFLDEELRDPEFRSAYEDAMARSGAAAGAEPPRGWEASVATDRPPYIVERSPGCVEYQLPISVKLVVDYYGRVPLLRNERDEWELPGGKLELGESPERSVRREVSEELGLTIAGMEIIDSWVYEITSVRHVFIVSYGTVYTGIEDLARSGEHKELGLFAYDEVPNLPMPEPYRATVARWHCRTSRTTEPAVGAAGSSEGREEASR